MSVTCTLCKNKNDFRYFVKYFKDSFEDIRKNDMVNDTSKFSYAHLICSSFFTELDLVILKDTTETNGEHAEKSNIIPSAIICNGKDLKEKVIDDCSICELPISKYILIPCSAKGCKSLFHYHCSKNRKDLGRIKLVKSDNTTFKYGFVCSKHNKMMAQNTPFPLRAENFSILKSLEEPMLETELILHENIILKSGSIMKEIKMDLEKTMQEFGAQLLPPLEDKNIKSSAEKIRSQSLAPIQTTVNTQIQASPKENNEKKVPITFEYDTFGDFYDMISDDEESDIKAKTFDESVYVALSNSVKENGVEKEEKKVEKIYEKESKDIEKPRKDRGKNVLKTLEDIYSEAGHLAAQESNNGNWEGHLDDSTRSEKAIQNIISARQKKTADGSNYNLRGEIKTNSKLEFDKKVFDYNVAPKKQHKEKEKQIHAVSEPPRSTEERKKWYWNEVNEGYFRKPHGDETDELTITRSANMKDIFRSELFRNYTIPTEDMKYNFTANFDIHELKTFTKPYFNTNFDTKDSLKVLFEPKDQGIWKNAMMCYFRMKKKAQNELNLPENTDNLSEETNPKYCVISSSKNKEMKSQFNESLKTLASKGNAKFMDSFIDDEDLSYQKYYSLFGLKHVDYLTNEESQEIKTRIMMQDDLNEVLEARENKEIDDINKEILSLNYLLYQFVISENNARKERVLGKVKEEEYTQNNQLKLQEKSRRLESELKFFLVKKYFKNGFKDKTQDMIDYLDSKHDNKHGAYQQNGSNIKNSNAFETDCCVCFHNQSHETNPIIYCSGCDSSFHQNCYGIDIIPGDDFYCDVCLYTNVNKKKSGGSSKARKRAQRMKTSDRKIPSDVYCRICLINEFPLKRMKKGEWFHLTCLILHDMVYHKNGEFGIKQERGIGGYNESNGVECFICNKDSGLHVKCRTRECKKHFHAMCAYLEGYEFELHDSKDSKDDKTRNGLETVIYCPDHQTNSKRTPTQQKYFRRYSTNYKNTSNYKTLEEYNINYQEEDIPTYDIGNDDILDLESPANLDEEPRYSKRAPEMLPDEIDSQISGSSLKKIKSD